MTLYQNIRHMVTSLKLLDTFLRTKLESIADGARTLGPDKQGLEVKWEMFKESFQVDLSRYHQQAESRNRITSPKMVTTWLRVEEELGASVTELCSRVAIVTDTVQEEARNIEKISADIAKLETDDTELKVQRGRDL